MQNGQAEGRRSDKLGTEGSSLNVFGPHGFLLLQQHQCEIVLDAG